MMFYMVLGQRIMMRLFLVLNENNEISATALYELGLLPSKEYKDLVKKMEDGEEIELETQSWSYEDICEQSFYLVFLPVILMKKIKMEYLNPFRKTRKK